MRLKNIGLGSLNDSGRPSIFFYSTHYKDQPKSMGFFCSAILVKPRLQEKDGLDISLILLTAKREMHVIHGLWWELQHGLNPIGIVS